ncbi:MAG: transcription antitermination factor NusB [Treponema sp.]|jgi:N utilization substance protein B|nr:transcription antitermination factor NusB [Treponema sp.]
MASRRKGRILAFQALYAWDAVNARAGAIPEGLLDFPWQDKGTGDDFSRLLVVGTVENISAVDSVIKDHLENWDFSRLNRVDLAILRISAYALMYQKDTPAPVVINEAVGIAREFGTDESFRFINGVLDSIHKALTQAGAAPEQ